MRSVILNSSARLLVPAQLSHLSDEWLRAASLPLHLSHPRARIRLEVAIATSEPMPDVTTATPGGIIAFIDVDRPDQSLVRVLVAPDRSPEVSPEHYTFVASTDPIRKVVGAAYSYAYEHTPILLDSWRQWRNRRPQRHSTPPDLAYRGPAPWRRPDGRPVVWIAMHWLEPGGAESWAFESAQIAHDLGFELIITADRPTTQRSLERALRLTPHVYLGSHSLTDSDWTAFIAHLVAEHNIVFTHIHHSAQTYQHLGWIRMQRPDMVVMDSTHVLEHRNHGFVGHSTQTSALIDHHHVISPQLRDHYLHGCAVAEEKVHYWPLVSADRAHTRKSADEPKQGPLTIGFLGRLAPQKRPLLFVELAYRLQRRHPGHFRFVMQGDGVLGHAVERHLQRRGLEQQFTRRPWAPVAQFFDEVDILVISSENEGLTLTTLEATEAGVPVLSARVGSQATVVGGEALLPAEPRGFLWHAEKVLWRIRQRPQVAAGILQRQFELAESLAHHPHAAVEYRRLLTTVKENHDNRSRRRDLQSATTP